MPSRCSSQTNNVHSHGKRFYNSLPLVSHHDSFSRSHRLLPGGFDAKCTVDSALSLCNQIGNLLRCGITWSVGFFSFIDPARRLSFNSPCIYLLAFYNINISSAVITHSSLFTPFTTSHSFPSVISTSAASRLGRRWDPQGPRQYLSGR